MRNPSAFFAAVLLAGSAWAADCKRTASVCIDATPTKVVSGVTVSVSEVGGCWMYEDTYVCLKPNAVDYCAPLIAAGCWQTSARCTQTDTLFGTGCMTQTNTYRCDDPSRPTPPNTIRLDNSYTLVSSAYNDTCPSPGPGCSLAENRCVQTTPDSPLPPGISPSAVAPDGCYKREKVHACSSVPAPNLSSCSASRSTCIDTTPSKVIDGVTVTLAQAGGCWKYKDECITSRDAVDYCAPLAVASGCRETASTCVQTDTTLGTGCMRYTKTYRCDDPSRPTPPNTIRLDNSYTLVSSAYDKSPCSSITANPMCHLAESRCVQTTPDTPLPPGISPTEVAPDGCYRREDTYACMTGRNDMGCAEYAANPDCTLVESKCDDEERANGQCLSTTKTYRCIEKRGATKTVTDCGTQQFCFNGACFDTGFTPDSDFAQVVTYMEAMREAGTYLDQGDLKLFKGIDSRCTRKALVNCCKAKSGGAPSNFMFYKTLIEGAGFAYDYARSKYMYDSLFTMHDFIFRSAAPNWLYNTLYGSQPMPKTPSFSYYGFSVQYGSAAPASWISQQLGVNAITTQLGNSAFYLSFDPISFGISLIMTFVLDELMSCDQSDMITGMRRGNNLCHYVGDYCSEKFLKVCIERKETYCCYNSRLAKIINVEGRKQLGKGWGSANSPDCSGFTAAELQTLDFSRMDLSEFYAEIVPQSLDIEAIKSSIHNRIVTNPTKSYFDMSRP